MPDNPALVARPRFMQQHDAYLNASPDNRRRFAQSLLSGEPLAGVYRSLGVGAAADWRHLEREFYAEEGALAYWPQNRWGFLGNKQEILRQGLLETVRIAEGLPETRMTRKQLDKSSGGGRPVETWWVSAGDRFEVDVLEGDNQVTMMIMTPRLPKLADKRKAKLENPGFIWTVAHKDVLKEYADSYPGGQKRYPTARQPYRTAKGAKAARDLRRMNKLKE